MWRHNREIVKPLPDYAESLQATVGSIKNGECRDILTPLRAIISEMREQHQRENLPF